ncbi:hypothetical protein NHQ30_010197 [Ciborinia camelliae]|nr:hypothetical protein NHQ30_010197 [Ciborinia camelliae]
MHTPSIKTLLTVGLLLSTPFTSAIAIPSIDKKSIAGTGIESIEARDIDGLITGLITRHHTEAQIAAKNRGATATTDNNKATNGTTKAGKKEKAAKNGRAQLFEEREAHHTEAQIAAKEAKAKAKGQRDVEEREPHHTEAQIAAKKAKAAEGQRGVEEREAHHTEAQIAAKEAKAKAKGQRDIVEEREPHHTEAQIAAKEAKAAKVKGQ